MNHAEKMFPIQSSGVEGELREIPWSLMQPHEDQAQANHGQSLERLAYRCGLSATEAVAIIEDKSYQERWGSPGARGYEHAASLALKKLVADFRQ